LALVRQAAAAGVERIVAVSVDLLSARATIELARREPLVVAAVGFHPSRLTTVPSAAEMAELAALAEEPVVGFIGEIGLDAVERRADLDVQLATLRMELDIARAVHKPVNFHVQGAFDLLLTLFEPNGLPTPGTVVHYFVGDAALADRLLRHGVYLSVGKPVTRPANADLREALRRVPLDRLLLETDSYPLPGRTTEPRDVRQVADAVAQLKGVALEDVAAATSANLAHLLGHLA
jgi:TatD DNase family protein